MSKNEYTEACFTELKFTMKFTSKYKNFNCEDMKG